MNPGRLDRRVILQVRALTKDATGSRVEAWEIEAELWAQKVSAKGSESIQADSDRSQISQQFRIRYRASLTTNNHRIFYAGKLYDIQAITEEGRKDAQLLDTTATQSVI